MAGKFEISKRKNGEFQFNLKAGNGQVILTSEGYSQMAGCQNGIESVRKHAADDKFYERKTAKDGSPYFVLKAGNGQVIGHSEMYSGQAACENGIASVKANAPDASVVDTTA
ncbi:YegP family protein [Luteimonas sp. e5]